MTVDPYEEYRRLMSPRPQWRVKSLLVVLAFLSVGVVWLNLAPPQIAPWWDCRVGKNSQNMEARVRLLSSCLRDGDLNDVQKAVAHFKRGNAYAVTGVVGRAIEDFNEAIRLYPDYGDAYYNRGRSYQELKKYKLAIKDFNAAIRVNPRDAAAFYNRGLIYIWTGKRARALADLDEAIRLKPDHDRALFVRGYLLDARGEHDQAIEDFTKAISLGPKTAKLYLYRARAHAKAENLDEAIRDANRAIKLSERPENTYSAANTRRFYDGFNLNNESYFRDLDERRSPQIYLLGKMALVGIYVKKLKAGDVPEIKKAQTFLKDVGYYKGPIDGVYRLAMLQGMIACVAAVNCTLRIDPVSGLN